MIRVDQAHELKVTSTEHKEPTALACSRFLLDESSRNIQVRAPLKTEMTGHIILVAL